MSLTLFAERYTNREIFGTIIPSTVYTSINPFFVILFSPFILKFFNFLTKFNIELNSIQKIALGQFIISLAFVFLVICSFSIVSGDHIKKVSSIWLILTHLFLTLGELMIVPIGLSLVSKLAPIRLMAFIMALWEIPFGLGGYLGAVIAGYMESIKSVSLFYLFFVVFNLISAISLFILSKKLLQPKECK